MATSMASSMRELTLFQMVLLVIHLISSWRCQVLMSQPYRWGFEYTTLEWDTCIAYATNLRLISASLWQLSLLELGATELEILSDWNDIITNLPPQHKARFCLGTSGFEKCSRRASYLILDTTLWHKRSYPIPQVRKMKLWEMYVTGPRLHNSSV